MKTPPNNLKDAFEALLIPSLAAELKYAKLFEQFSGLAVTAELGTVLSPARNEFDQQAERLRLLFKQLKLRPVRECLQVDEVFLAMGKEVCGYKKQQSLYKDIQIISLAKQITYHRIAIYSILDVMAGGLRADDVGLLKQSCEEIRNSAGYFSQIEQNILYPAIKNTEGA
ncbi:MAG: DUF892 family protein [Pedobacter sp.]|nr:MAG: DUF892 family protein [Pedobacter sp.]